MTLRRFLAPAALIVVFAAGRAVAQVLPVTVPKGVLRFDFDGEFKSWDRRWHDGSREEWAARFNQSLLGAAALPGVETADSVVAKIIGTSNVDLSAGSTHGAALVNFGTIGFGGSLGLTKRLTLFGRVPFVQVQVRPSFGFDGTNATLGLAVAGANALLIGQLGSALGDLDQQITSGSLDSDPVRKAQAQQLLAQGMSLQANLSTLLGADPSTPFAPLASSAEGQATSAAVTSFSQALEGFGITSLTAAVTLPTAGFGAQEFDAFLTDPAGPVAIRPLDELPILSYIGDVELGAAWALVDRFPASGYGDGIRSVVRGTARLPTGRLPNPSRLLEVGTGDRQRDLQVELITDLAKGRFGARVQGGYNLQLPGSQNRRVASPEVPFPAAATFAEARRDPGDEWWLAAQPFVRLATYLSLGGAVQYYRKGLDRYSYAAGQAAIPGVDISVLAEGSKQQAFLLGGSLSYVHSGVDRRGRQRMPMEASIRYQRIVRSTTGILPDANQLQLSLHFYTRVWR